MRSYRRMRLVSLLAAVTLVSIASLAQSSSQGPAPRIIEAVDNSKLVKLTGNTHPMARAEFDKGIVAPDLPMERMLLLLKRSPEQEAALDRFMSEQLDPASPNYHRWLSPAEFGRQYGPSDADILQITSWLQNEGFQVTNVSAGKVTIEFSGTAVLVQRAFHTEIHRYVIGGRERTANASDPQIPAALAPVVAGISSLHNFFPQPQSVFGRKVRRDSATGRITPVEASSHTASPLFVFTDSYGNTEEDITPYDFAAIYNVLPLWNAGIDGAGQTIAISGVSDVSSSDVAGFRTVFGLPANPPKVILNGPDPGYIPGGRGENTLDVEWSGAIAPKATIVLVVSADTQTSSGDQLSDSYIIDNKIAPIISASYGECELGLGTTGNATYNQLWQQAAAEGISVFESAGDQGSAGCESQDNPAPNPATTGLQVNGLASSPYLTAVGGTDFVWQTSPISTYWNATNNSTTGATAKGYIPEIPWDSTCTSSFLVSQSVDPNAEAFCNDVALGVNYVDLSDLVAISTGSGGVSRCTTPAGSTPASCAGGYAKPSWQAGTGVPGDGKRDLPDVSLFASAGYPDGLPGSAYLFCDSELTGSCDYSDPNQIIYQEVGGTSVSSPAMAGIMALVLQKTGSAQGLANPTLYKLFANESLTNCNTSSVKAGNGCIFYDITTGTNAVVCVPGSLHCITSVIGDSYGVLSSYASKVGYDRVTGLGSVNAANLVNSWNSSTSAPSVALTPASLIFPDTQTGSTSPAQTVAIKNTGTATLAFTATYITGTDAADFLKSTQCASTEAPGASCTVTVSFRPAAAGLRSAVLNIADNVTGSPQKVPLSGTGTASTAQEIDLTPGSVIFGDVTVGQTSTPQPLLIANPGAMVLDFNGSYITGPDAADFLKSTQCGSTVPPYGNCTITLNFRPAARACARQSST